jgi:hypothetical protein
MKKAVLAISIALALLVLVCAWQFNRRAFYLKPNVKIVSIGARDTSSLTDYKATIWACVRNDGAAGRAVIAFSYQEKNLLTKTLPIEIGTNETKTAEMEFPEATLLSDGKYWVEISN